MKVFMKNWQPNKTKQFRLHSLLRIYSLVMIIIISCFALLISYADWDMREEKPIVSVSVFSLEQLMKLNTTIGSQPA